MSDISYGISGRMFMQPLNLLLPLKQSWVCFLECGRSKYLNVWVLRQSGEMGKHFEGNRFIFVDTVIGLLRLENIFEIIKSNHYAKPYYFQMSYPLNFSALPKIGDSTTL